MKDFVIVLLHGWGQNSSSMEVFEDELRKYYKVININLLKLNDNKIYSINDYVEDLHQKLNNEQNLVLIGHSFGGKIASFYSLKYKVEKLILIAPSTYIKKPLITKLKIRIYKCAKRLNLANKITFFESEDYKRLAPFHKKTFNNILINMSDLDQKKITIPTLLIGFKNDKKVPLSNLKHLHRTIKNSILITFEGDHFGYFDHYEDLTLNFMDFINEL